MPYTVWIDVEDIFRYFDGNSRPSGIQRLVYEILRVIRERAAASDPDLRLRLIRAHRDTPEAGAAIPAFAPVAFDEIDEVFNRRADAQPGVEEESLTSAVDLPPEPPAEPEAEPQPGLRHRLIARLEALPPEIGAPLLDAAVSQLRALRLIRHGLSSGRRAAEPEPGPEPEPEPTAIEAVPPAPAFAGPDALPPGLEGPRPGDVLLILGAPWTESRFGERLAHLRAAFGIRPVLLVYDLIPALRPEWCSRVLVAEFRHWLDTTLPQCRRLLAISRATARSVEAYAAREGLSLAAPVRTTPIGSGFGTQPAVAAADNRPLGLPPPRSYVLIVSTIEARKNHALAFAVWRRLLDELPRQEVPTLVFAGRVGWLVADLMQQIENTAWLQGKLRLLRDPSDDELAHLYDGCLFTLFPSFFEGWGLPVTESLIHGAPCVASNATSIPEAGGALTRYFDPDNVDDALRVVRDTLADRPGIEAWRAQVRREFRPVAWGDTADAVLEACQQAHLDPVGD